ncbi:unnamed protein product [Soboliphyme baturini]|uniref:CARD domain-containing protein n=1 Tax=Soboliphyme baturini TaxID=241478 RepID=A0A183IMD8_9BILA|nr:unnamed protein product [Soboliphyme baturini]
MFGSQTIRFTALYKCLMMKKKDREDFIAYVGRSPEDANIRLQLLNRIEKEDDVTIPKLVAECNRLLRLKHDTEMVESTSATDFADITTVARSQHIQYCRCRQVLAYTNK